MDELLHFTAPAIEMLRESLEGVSLSRRVERRENTRPRAAFQLLAATNLCPCGLWDSGDPLGGRCRCSIGRRLRYQSGLTGPIADRIGLWCHWKQEAPEVSWEELMNRARGIFERSDNRAEQAAQGTVLPSEIEDRLREIEASSRRRGRALRSVLTALAKVKGGGLGLVEWGQAQRWTQPMMQE
jgi:predicted ATPase with chaperone activity